MNQEDGIETTHTVGKISVCKILDENDTAGFTIFPAKRDNNAFQRIAGSRGLASPALYASGKRQQAAIGAISGTADPAALVRLAYGAE